MHARGGRDFVRSSLSTISPYLLSAGDATAQDATDVDVMTAGDTSGCAAHQTSGASGPEAMAAGGRQLRSAQILPAPRMLTGTTGLTSCGHRRPRGWRIHRRVSTRQSVDGQGRGGQAGGRAAQVRGDHGEVVNLLAAAGAKVRATSGALVDLQTTQLARCSPPPRRARPATVKMVSCYFAAVSGPACDEGAPPRWCTRPDGQATGTGGGSVLLEWVGWQRSKQLLRDWGPARCPGRQ